MGPVAGTPESFICEPSNIETQFANFETLSVYKYPPWHYWYIRQCRLENFSLARKNKKKFKFSNAPDLKGKAGPFYRERLGHSRAEKLDTCQRIHCGPIRVHVKGILQSNQKPSLQLSSGSAS